MNQLRQAIEEFKAATDLFDLLGGERLERQAGTNGGEWAGPCPLCGGRDRLRVWPRCEGGARAWCRRCGEQGDALTWAMLLDSADPDEAGGTGRWLRRQGHGTGARRLVSGAVSAPQKRSHQAEVRRRIPPAELRALWEQCLPVVEAREVRRYLEDVRQLDAGAVADLDLARAVPRRGALPHWARCGGDWRERGYWLVLPMFDAAGRMVNLHARSCLAPQPKPKSVNPVGGSHAGTAFACPMGARVLAGERDALDLLERVSLNVVEGVGDFLRMATHHGSGVGLERAPAVFGLMKGSWTEGLAAGVPLGARVCVAPHADEAGEQLMNRVADSLRERCTLRWYRVGAK